MRGQTTVIEGGNIAAMLADMREEEIETSREQPEEKPEPKAEAKPEVKAEPKAEPKDEDDDVDFAKRLGLTDEQHQEVTRMTRRAVDRKHRALKEAEDFAADQYNERKLAEERAARFERELARYKNQPEAKPANEGKPARADYESDEAYAEAMVEWRVEERFRAKEAKEAQERAERAQSEIVANAEKRIAAARELVPDWQEVVASADVPVPPYIAAYMQESELLAELGYHLAQNPEILENLSEMTPHRALVEIGKIESKLTPFAKKSETAHASKATAEKATVTASEPSREAKPRASAPIQPLPAGAGTSAEGNSQRVSYREAKAQWERENGVNFSRRKRH